MNTITVGDAGQRYAERFLKQKGYKFIERNWRAKFGEIDIVYTHGEDLVFVEVKALIGASAVFQPEDHLNFAKQQKLRRLAQAYVNYKRLGNVGYQIDLVAVDLDESLNLVNVRHYEGVV